MDKKERVKKLTNSESQNYWKKVTEMNMEIPKINNNPSLEFYNWYERIINRINYYGTEWEKQMNVKCGCHVGCKACCSMIIEIYKLEAFVIIEYIKRTNQEYLFKRVEDVCSEIKDIVTTSPLGNNNHDEIEKFKLEYLKKKIPCIFLVDGKCSIYPVRPINCATYHSYGKSEECLKDDKVNNEESDAFVVDWPLEPWSSKQFLNFFRVNNKKYKSFTEVIKCGVLPLLIKECLDTEFDIVKK